MGPVIIWGTHITCGVVFTWLELGHGWGEEGGQRQQRWGEAAWAVAEVWVEIVVCLSCWALVVFKPPGFVLASPSLDAEGAPGSGGEGHVAIDMDVVGGGDEDGNGGGNGEKNPLVREEEDGNTLLSGTSGDEEGNEEGATHTHLHTHVGARTPLCLNPPTDPPLRQSR